MRKTAHQKRSKTSKSTGRKTASLTLRISEDLEIAIRSHCDSTDMNPSTFVRRTLRQVLDGLANGSLVILNDKIQPNAK